MTPPASAASLRRPATVFAVAVVLVVVAELLRIYWIMPFPGSQGGDTIERAYFLHRWIWVARVLLGVALVWSLLVLWARGRWRTRLLTVLGLLVVGVVAFLTQGPMSADVVFQQPRTLAFASGPDAAAPETVVVGVALTDAAGRTQARAYPLQLIGYHHQVRDEVAGRPVMVTYCTVCRSGRVYDPVVDGDLESFRLVGMEQWNALFEDAATGSWWRQATGEAVVGPRRGETLREVPSRQMTWAAWRALHPESEVMQPDPLFTASYERLAGFAEGTNESINTGRDEGSWRPKSWVVGVLAGDAARAFDWNELVAERAIADRVGDVPVVVVLAADDRSFHAFDARPGGTGPVLELEPTDDPTVFRDPATGTTWDETGRALDGPHEGTRLVALPAYQEFWHSWRTFRPETTARRAAGS